MGKRNKLYKVRDADATTNNLKDAFRAYIAEFGFKGLNATKLAEIIGVHPSRITRLFTGGLDGVVKDVVTDHDYWKPFFEKFCLPAAAKAWQVLELFKQLMVANFSTFFTSEDMQHVILGQISFESAVLREISENRERDGAVLLALTDKNFKHSGVSFRAVLALLLGGAYYLVLHARYNKSTVCGIDINKENDYREVKETIAYIIDLVWRDGAKKRKRAAKK